MYNNLTKEEFSESILVEEVINKNLVVYNDHVNTFDFVIESLIKVCKHEVLQAEQCTYLIHYKGKCAVKTGSFDDLEPMCSALLNRNITAEIE